MLQNINVFEVLDNYFGTEICPDVNKMNSGEIRALREHVVKFYKVFGYPTRGDLKTRLFLGGFLSSPPLVMESAPYLSSALLISDSVMVYDPLHYWFSDEQYSLQKLMSASPGWLDPNSGQPNYPLTKNYLVNALDWLYRVRPLVENGVIVLIPAERIAFTERGKIKRLFNGIVSSFEPIENLASFRCETKGRRSCCKRCIPDNDNGGLHQCYRIDTELTSFLMASSHNY